MTGAPLKPSDCNERLPGAPVIGFSDLLGVNPYYKNQWCAVLKGDCREILPTIPSKTFNLLLTDPPYGVEFVSNHRTATPSWGAIVGDDGSLDVVGCLKMALERCTDFNHVYVFGPFDLSALKLAGLCELIWDKAITSGGDLENVWGVSHEKIQFGVNSGGRTREQNGQRYGLAAKKRRGSVLRCLRPNGGACVNHPTEKPVELLRQLIESSTIMGEIILDPFVGCGSTLVAAHMEGRYAIGIEYEEKHCETAAKRLEQLGAW